MMQHVEHQDGRRGSGAERQRERRPDHVNAGARAEIERAHTSPQLAIEAASRADLEHETAGCGTVQNGVVLRVVVAIEVLEKRLLANETSVDDRGFGGIEIEAQGERVRQQAAQARGRPAMTWTRAIGCVGQELSPRGRATIGTVNGPARGRVRRRSAAGGRMDPSRRSTRFGMDPRALSEAPPG